MALATNRRTTMQPTKKDNKTFLYHRGNAKRRGVAFNLTFDQWWNWWIGTGKYALRGRGKGKYVMARCGDTGPYALGNIYCCEFGENVAFAQTGKPKSEVTKCRMRKPKKAKAPFTGLVC
jgi:hypothetical protein